MDQQNISTDGLPTQKSSVSSFAGIIEVFYQPAAWFEKLRKNPKVLIPYLVLGVLTIAVFYLLGDYIVQMQLDSPQMQEQLQGNQLPADAAEMMWWSTVIGGSLVMLLAPLVAAALAMFWGGIVFGGKASFKAVLSVMLYGEIIYAVGNLLVAPLVIAKDSLAVGLNLGVLAANRGLQDPLFVALSKCDLFIIWEIIAIGIGLSVIYGFARNKGVWLSVLSMGLLTAFGIGAALIGSLI